MGAGSSTLEHLDHYSLLGLDDLRQAATPEQIRKAYHKCALKHHPDKRAAELLAEPIEAARAAKKEKIDIYFKSIQAAYDVLKDPVMRQSYDSSRLSRVHDSSSNSTSMLEKIITMMRRSTSSYFSSQSNGNTSEDHSDDEDSKEDEIPSDCAPEEFFDVFGAAFEKNARWSDTKPVPGLGGEGTPMEKVDEFYEFWFGFTSNRDFAFLVYKRDRLLAMKKERLRIKRLTRNAYDRDPRILRRKEEKKAEKEKQKLAKKMLKEEAARAAARAAEEERRRMEEEEKRVVEEALEQKKVKDKERKLLKKERSRFRTLSLGLALHGLGNDDVERLFKWLDYEKLRKMCERIEGGNDEGLVQEELSKIVSQIKRDEDEKKKIREHNNDENVNHGKEDRPWRKEEIELLRKGMVKFPKGTPRRWEVVSDFIGTGRSVEEVVKAMKTVVLKKPDDSKAFDSFLEKRKPSKSANYSTSFSTSSIEEGVLRIPSTNDDVWSFEQERVLIQALKTVPKKLSGGARWKWVAAAVPGNKTANQCKKKLALFRENLKSKIQNSA